MELEPGSKRMTLRERAFVGRIGVARVDITPPVGIYARNWGAAQHDTAEGIHRPLTATALTLQSGEGDDTEPLVLISLDLGWWRTAADEWFLRGYLLETLELHPERLIVSLIHTHSGPSLCMEDADKPGGAHIGPYRERVRDAVLTAIRQAWASARPATLEVATGLSTLACNRDLPDPNAERYLTGFRPGATADNTLLAGRVIDEGGKTRVTVVNYACHPTTLAHENRLISPDFIGAMRETVEDGTDRHAPCLFLQGASGELAPREQYVSNPAIADRHGSSLGYAVLSTLKGMLPRRTELAYAGVVESGAPLAVYEHRAYAPPRTLAARQITVELPVKEDWPSAAEYEAQLTTCTDRALSERLRRRLRVRHSLGDGQTAHVPVWLWRMGDVLVVGHPNEAYSNLQTELRAAFPEYAVIVMNLVNGWSGYLPPADLYERDMYSVWQTPFAKGGLETLIARCRAEMATLD
jgi:hypothetical protein